MTFQTFFNFIIWVYNEFLASKKHKIKFLGRGVLRDEFLHMWELSTFHSLQLSISSYGLKTFSHRPKVLFDFCEKRWKMAKTNFLERGILRDELLPVRELSTFHSVQLSISSYGLKTFSHRPKLLFDFYEKRWKITKIKFLERKTLQDEFLHLWGLSGWNSRHFVTWSKTPFPLWSKKTGCLRVFFLSGTHL